jgi:hypothetical protein
MTASTTGAGGAPWPPRDLRRAYRQIGRYLDALTRECERSHAAEGRRFLEQAQAAFAQVDPDVSSADTISLDHALSYGHRALNAHLHQYRMPTHDPEAFAGFYDVTQVPFRELM